MRCTKVEKWISDSLDRELSDKEKMIVENHLNKCSSCRIYKMRAEKIQEMSETIKMPEVNSAYQDEFSARLKAKLSSFKLEKEKGGFLLLKPPWAYLVGGSALLLVITVLFLFLFPHKSLKREIYLFSFEAAVGQIYQEIGDNSELENLFNSMILMDISDLIEDSSGLYDKLLFWENLTEEEMEFLESEIKKEKESFGGL